jgi:prepilin-type N-terminal cleavage/methylation domain-containing protein
MKDGGGKEGAKPSNRTPKGFSLLEVVVAIALIALCAMLLLPFRASSERVLAQRLRTYEALWLARSQAESFGALPYEMETDESFEGLRSGLGLVAPGQSAGVVRRKKEDRADRRDYLVVDEKAEFVEYLIQADEIPQNGSLFAVRIQWVPFGGAASKEDLRQKMNETGNGSLTQGRLLTLGACNPDLGWARNPGAWVGSQTPP